jgi:hypothetical protein
MFAEAWFFSQQKQLSKALLDKMSRIGLIETAARLDSGQLFIPRFAW